MDVPERLHSKLVNCPLCGCVTIFQPPNPPSLPPPTVQEQSRAHSAVSWVLIVPVSIIIWIVALIIISTVMGTMFPPILVLAVANAGSIWIAIEIGAESAPTGKDTVARLLGGAALLIILLLTATSLCVQPNDWFRIMVSGVASASGAIAAMQTRSLRSKE